MGHTLSDRTADTLGRAIACVTWGLFLAVGIPVGVCLLLIGALNEDTDPQPSAPESR